MEERVFKILEYDKILAELARLTNSEMTRDKVMKLYPSKDINKIKHMQKETSEAFNIIIKNGNIPISRIKDIRSALKRADIGGILSPKDLLEIADVLKVSNKIKRYIENAFKEDKLTHSIIKQDIKLIKNLKNIEEVITSSILNEDEIADKASQELANIRKKKQVVNNKIKNTLDNIIASQHYQKYLQENIVTVREGRYVVPVKAEYRANVQGLVHDTSASGSTLFIEPMTVVQGNNQLRELEVKEKNEIEKILAELTMMIQGEIEYIRGNLDVIIKLDFVFAKARLALNWNAVPPKMNCNKYINIKQGRHPLLDSKIVVPIDFYIGKDFDTLVITGPNTGGKTVTLKTVGLFTLMAQSGLHIPAKDGTEMAVFDNIFADIGDEQSIEQNLSTFSSHMKNIIKILSQVDSNSLALFDELGAGTDPVEGAGLAMSVLEHLRMINSTTIATTHYSELKLFAIATEGIENASCEFNVETLAPTYKLLIGLPGKSNAFAISQRLGLNYNIIKRAKEYISAEDIEFEDIISNIEKDRQISNQQKEEALLYKQEIENLKNDISRQKQEIESNKEKILNEARKEARRIIQQAKDKTEYLLAEIRRLEKEKEEGEKNRSIGQIRSELRNNISKLDKAISSSTIPSKRYSKQAKNLKSGEDVYILTLDKKGRVLNPPDSSGEVQVQVGIMKVNVHISNLRLIENNKEENKSYTMGLAKIGASKIANISSELDLRGQVLDEALHNTDKFLDDASLAGLQKLTIIHGKGTGALRTGIHSMLKTHNHVKDFRLGKYGEGESGVTLVELK